MTTGLYNIQDEYKCHTRMHLLVTLRRFDTDKVAKLSSIYNKASINAFSICPPILCSRLILGVGDSSGASLGVRSVALLHPLTLYSALN